MMPPKLLLFLSYSHALTIATLGWSPCPLAANFRVENSAARLAVRAPPHVHITPILGHVHWLPVRIQYPIRLHASLSTPSPPPPLLVSLTFYICTLLLDLFAPVPTPPLQIPFYKCRTIGDRAFSYFGPSVWNSLPLHIRNATTVDTFKPALKTYIFNFQQSD